MEDFILSVIQNGSGLNQIILSVMFIWIIYFITKAWWPDRVKRSDHQQELDHTLAMKQVETEKELRLKELEMEIKAQDQLMKQLEDLKTAINSMAATFNDFLANLLSQVMEERKEQADQVKKLIDTGIFHSSERRKE